ncbi:ATP-dependent helicase [Bacillus methanolicus]|uniref:DEAD/DEAH box helicase n=1 Tax=Bacillus methanolicus TaxID=1471 RepID=UPI00200C1B84|nr:DEAD/DEAH box helicase [Bacillus methanolicus]UQD51150.1 ATP-dependent helicase [Bacillus methanolicus]
MSEKQSIIKSLQPFIQEAWNKSGFENLTSIQKQTIPLILQGKDVVAESPTGTGKTLSYLLPLLHKIDQSKKSVQVVILAPSQELVMQILGEFQKWSEGSGIRGASFIGGANLKRQLEKLKKNPHVVIGTPGRTFELIKQKKLKMHEVKTVVLDEGDQLLNSEHVDTVKNIIKTTLSDRQIVLFSATLAFKTEEVAKGLANEPEVIRVKKDEAMSFSKVDHIYFVSEQRDKINLLEKAARLKGIKALVFVNDIGRLQILAEKLSYKEFQTEALHSEMSKIERQHALRNFRTGETNILLATDVAARGLDINGITHVIHFNFPKDMNQYVHRSGRTGRFGATGTVISFVTDREERELKKIAKELKISVHKKVFYKGEITDDRMKNHMKS